MKSPSQQTPPVAPGAQPGPQPGSQTEQEPSRIAAAISRILLITRATAQSTSTPVQVQQAAAAGGEPAGRSDGRSIKRDATPVEWALRMMF